MVSDKVDKILDDFFSGADKIIITFGSKFTFSQFLRKLSQQKQKLYILLLYESKDNTFPFQVVHLLISVRLRTLANDLGYNRDNQEGVNPKRYDQDVFGNSQVSIIYTKNE